MTCYQFFVYACSNEAVNLTNGDYNGNLYLRKKSLNMILYVVFGLPLV